MNKEQRKYLKIIKTAGLVHASSRQLPLISVSSIFYGYNKLLKIRADYSYGDIACIGKADKALFLINEDKAGELFGRYAKSKAVKIIKRFQIDFKKHQRLIKQEPTTKNYWQVLKTILDIYPLILCHIGFYQSVLRYVKYDVARAKVLGGLGEVVVKDKDVVAKKLIYGGVEPLLNKIVGIIGRINGFDGDLLRYLTLDEFKQFYLKRKISKVFLAILKSRRQGYFCLYHKSTYFISTDSSLIKQIHRGLIVSVNKTRLIKGVSAYKGKVTGEVCVSFHGIKKKATGSILVTNMTNPKDNISLKKFSAIVTDEGGLLSHAAIMARELKIPCVMGTKVGTKVLKNGDVVEVDANKGIVRKL